MASFVVGIEEYVADKLHDARYVVFRAENGQNSVRAATGEELAKVAFDALEEYMGQRPGSTPSAGRDINTWPDSEKFRLNFRKGDYFIYNGFKWTFDGAEFVPEKLSDDGPSEEPKCWCGKGLYEPHDRTAVDDVSEDDYERLLTDLEKHIETDESVNCDDGGRLRKPMPFKVDPYLLRTVLQTGPSTPSAGNEAKLRQALRDARTLLSRGGTHWRERKDAVAVIDAVLADTSQGVADFLEPR